MCEKSTVASAQRARRPEGTTNDMATSPVLLPSRARRDLEGNRSRVVKARRTAKGFIGSWRSGPRMFGGFPVGSIEIEPRSHGDTEAARRKSDQLLRDPSVSP